MTLDRILTLVDINQSWPVKLSSLIGLFVPDGDKLKNFSTFTDSDLHSILHIRDKLDYASRVDLIQAGLKLEYFLSLADIDQLKVPLLINLMKKGVAFKDALSTAHKL